MTKRGTMMEALLREFWNACSGNVSQRTAREFFRSHESNEMFPNLAKRCAERLNRPYTAACAESMATFNYQEGA